MSGADRADAHPGVGVVADKRGDIHSTRSCNFEVLETGDGLEPKSGPRTAVGLAKHPRALGTKSKQSSSVPGRCDIQCRLRRGRADADIHRSTRAIESSDAAKHQCITLIDPGVCSDGGCVYKS